MAATLAYKETACNWLLEDSKRTQVEACELLKNGTMPKDAAAVAGISGA
jgi:hypothetical protein